MFVLVGFHFPILLSPLYCPLCLYSTPSLFLALFSLILYSLFLPPPLVYLLNLFRRVNYWASVKLGEGYNVEWGGKEAFGTYLLKASLGWETNRVGEVKGYTSFPLWPYRPWWSQSHDCPVSTLVCFKSCRMPALSLSDTYTYFRSNLWFVTCRKKYGYVYMTPFQTVIFFPSPLYQHTSFIHSIVQPGTGDGWE